MNVEATTPAPGHQHDATRMPASSLRGARWRLARAAWLAIAGVAVVMFVASVPLSFDDRRAFPAASPADSQALRAGFEGLGISGGVYAAYHVAILVALAGMFAGVGALVFWRRPGDPAALYFSLTLVTFGVIWPNTFNALVETYPATGPVADGLDILGFGSFFLLFYLFPTGRFVPGWTRWLAGVFMLWLAGVTFFPESIIDDQTWPFPLNLIALVFPLTMLFAQIYRYRRVSTTLERQQTKWVIAGLVTALVGFIGLGLFEELVAVNRPGWPIVIFDITSGIVYGLVFMLIPIAIGVAVLRYRLWDIDPVINRALVYGALTTGVIAIYVIVVGWLGVVFRTGDNLVFSLAATGLVAVLFQPMRVHLQRGVNRLMYGDRDDPYAVISRLGRRLEDAFAPSAIMPAIVDTITEALRLPYAAITLQQGDTVAVAAANGVPVANPIRLPLVYQLEPVGELLVAPRSPGEPFSVADRRLLEDLARQAGVAAHAVRLTSELQQARERLVEAREEERRRLRRELHDGLGSQLVALNMELGTIRREVERDPSVADAHIQEVRAELRAAIASIRQIAHDLRPPVLDDLGLCAALQARVRQYSSGHVAIALRLPDDLPALSAAAEVAIYRIVEEALTNVVRHAWASQCSLDLAVTDGILLTIEDDGAGIPADRQAGVGMLSMRERAEELGGTFEVASASDRGSRLTVWLPLGRE
ncbi:MAG: histidine kinase [Chloroflexota bacterium]|nr:histidine kinase [Chloroflexota bacterium]